MKYAFIRRYEDQFSTVRLHHSDFVSRDAARAEIFDYIELFYNRSRMHQSLGYVSPVYFEQLNAGA